MLDLNFRVESVEPLEFAAVPTLLFKLDIENRGLEPVSSITLQTQIRIQPDQRLYTATEQAGLIELFGSPDRWGHTHKSLLWTHTVVRVPPFQGRTVVDMPVTCTYDFDVVSAKYFHAVEGGEVPLAFLFSGTIFYQGPSGGLQVVQIPWEKEAGFRLPVRTWKRMMQHFFPHSAWLRLGSETFDRLYQYKTRRGLPSWDAALLGLLRETEAKAESR